MFFGHHLNTSCSESTFKNASVLIIHITTTRSKPFTLLANMWPMKKRHFQVAEAGEENYSAGQISSFGRQLSKTELKFLTAHVP